MDDMLGDGKPREPLPRREQILIWILVVSALGGLLTGIGTILMALH